MTLLQTIAAPFRQSRKTKLKKTEIVYFLAFERKWMSISQANMVIARGETNGLLEKEGDLFSPLFNPGTVEIPLGFRPSSEIFGEQGPLANLLDRIGAATSQSETQVAAELNHIIKQEFDGIIWPEAAALILAKRHGVAFEDVIPLLKEQAMKKD